MSDTPTPTSGHGAQRMPSFYVPHGARPCFFMDWDPPEVWDSMGNFLRAIPSIQPQRPRAIVVVTAHWQAPAFTVGSSPQPAMLYDYYGVPPHTFALRYDAPGDRRCAAWGFHCRATASAETRQAARFEHYALIKARPHSGTDSARCERSQTEQNSADVMMVGMKHWCFK